VLVAWLRERQIAEASGALMLYRSWFGSPTAWVRVAVNPGHEEVFPCTSTLMLMPVP